MLRPGLERMRADQGSDQLLIVRVDEHSSFGTACYHPDGAALALSLEPYSSVSAPLFCISNDLRARHANRECYPARAIARNALTS